MQVLVTRTVREQPTAWEVFLGGRIPVEVSPLAGCEDVLAVTFGGGDEQQQEADGAEPEQRSEAATEGELGEDGDDVRGERDDPKGADGDAGEGTSPTVPAGERPGGAPDGDGPGHPDGR